MARTSIEIDSFRHQNPIPAAARIGPLIEPIVDAYRRTRPEGVFDHLAANPAA